MKIVGCDLHTRYQQIAMLDDETGELIERRLEHANGEAKGFYTSLRGPVRVGIESTGYTRWFERLLAELKQELWVGDAARRVARAFEFVFSLPISKLWVPRCCALCNGGNDAAGTMTCYAQRLASHLCFVSPALYHLFLLPAIVFSELGKCSRPLRFNSRRYADGVIGRLARPSDPADATIPVGGPFCTLRRAGTTIADTEGLPHPGRLQISTARCDI